MERKQNTTTPTWSCRSSQPVVSVLLLHLHPAEENMTSLYAGTSLKDRPFSTTNVSLYQPHTNTYGLRAEHRTNKRYFQLRKFAYTPPWTTKKHVQTHIRRERNKKGVVGGFWTGGGVGQTGNPNILFVVDPVVCRYAPSSLLLLLLFHEKMALGRPWSVVVGIIGWWWFCSVGFNGAVDSVRVILAEIWMSFCWTVEVFGVVSC